MFSPAAGQTHATPSQRASRPMRPFTLVDRYLLRLIGPPMAAAVTVVLIALLLERLLRLVNALTASSTGLPMFLELMADLVPHYLGLALPAAFFVTVFSVSTRLSENNEVDALLANGLSVPRLTAPYVLAGAVLAVASVILFGFVQPYGRYGFNADLHEALNAGWNARVQPRTFVDAGEFTLTADKVDATGRRLEGVFLRRVTKGGWEEVITAASGRLGRSDDGTRFTLALKKVQHFRERDGSGPVVGGVETLGATLTLDVDRARYRPRGSGERELTLPELRRQMRNGQSRGARARAAAEFHARIARSAYLPLVPLLAVPLGMAAKRGRSGVGFALCAALFLLLQHGIQTGQTLADMGRVPAPVGIWTPPALFAGVSVWLFMRSRTRPGETPFTPLLDAIGEAVDRMRARLPVIPSGMAHASASAHQCNRDRGPAPRQR